MALAQTDIERNDRMSEDDRTIDMIRIPGGTFRMGSDKHYPEEAPVHRVTVDGFWIDPTPVTNRQFKRFVLATGHKTSAEIPPDPKHYPGALPHMLYAGSLVFVHPASTFDLRDWSQWWSFMKGADWRHPYGPKSNINVFDDHPAVLRMRIANHSSLGASKRNVHDSALPCHPRREGFDFLERDMHVEPDPALGRTA